MPSPASSPEPPQKHGVAAGEGYVPPSPDWTIDQGWEQYSAEEHGVWRTLFERQTKLLPERACKAYVEGMRNLPMSADEIPDFRRLSDALMKATGWQVVAVPGLVPHEVFFEHLANRRFPSGQFIRKPHELDYLEEPDVFHDVFGHVPLLMNPVFADYIQAYGEGGLRAHQRGVVETLARVYWYTVEFGLMEEDGGVRLYGAGIASSRTESVFCLDDPSPNRIGFDLERVMRTNYRIDDFQETYFVIKGFEQLYELAQLDFGPFYDRVAGMPDIEPREVLETDAIYTRGSGSYHVGKRRASGHKK